MRRIHGGFVVAALVAGTTACVSYAIPDEDKTTIDMFVDDAGFAAISSGTYSAWDCPNAMYGMSGFTTESVVGHSIYLSFGGRRLNLPMVADAYASLPNQTNKPSISHFLGDASDVCASYAGDTYSYVFKKGEGDCPAGCTEITYWGFSTEPDGTVTVLGKQNPNASGMSAWLASLPECTKWL